MPSTGFVDVSGAFSSDLDDATGRPQRGHVSTHSYLQVVVFRLSSFSFETTRTRPYSLADEALLRGSDDLLVDFDRAFHMFQEFVSGCRGLFDVGPAVTVFGSARFPEDHRYYQLARDLGRELARRRYTVITGGGPGIMEAANRGAREGGYEPGAPMVASQTAVTAARVPAKSAAGTMGSSRSSDRWWVCSRYRR